MESINSFSGGMNSDISKQIHSKDSYLQALNFRSLTELGASNGSLVNIKGNQCKLTFPDIQNVYKLQLFPGTPGTTPNSMQLTINGTTKTTLITNSTSGADLYNWIILEFPNCYQYTGATVVTKTFDVAYEDDYIVLYQQTIYQDCSPVASIDTEVSILYDTTDGTRALLYFINSGVPKSLTQDTGRAYVPGVLFSNIVPIGSTFILDEIYILTAPDNTVPSFNDELTDPGTIWRLNIDDITKQHTLTLVYHNKLDFTKFYPIPPSAITGRYESTYIKRIYWSDNYNKIRTINTAQAQLMALNPSQLSVIPKVEFTQAILNNIGTGSLDAGCYQMGYRLSKILGSVTNYSELSNPVYLTTNAESDAFEIYQASLGATGKSIIWTLTNLDTSYDQIEPIVVYRDSDTAIPTITSLGLSTLNENMTFEYKSPGTSGYSEVTLEEFLLFNGTFTHAKTVDTKDNRLFWGNVRAPRKDLESYDARAFRANVAGDILLKNNGASQSYATVAAAAALAQTSDTINEYYDSNGDYSANACYLKPSTAGSTNILGGEGLNISYEFGTWSVSSDVRFCIESTANYDIGTLPPAAWFRQNDVDSSTITLTDYAYPQNNRYFSLKQPEKTGLLKGFQHEEIYRFGIQFFDKQGNPYFTKWIGDIKMPSYGDYNNNPDAEAAAQGINDFRLSYMKPYPADRFQFTQILYIKFTVDISSIQSLIGGYQIVRVKRDSVNKTIHGVGMLNPFWPDASNNGGSLAVLPASWDGRRGTFGGVGGGLLRYYTPSPSQFSVENLNSNGSYSNFDKFKMFDCWDMDVNLRPDYAAGDKILVRSRLKCANYNGTSGSNSYRLFPESPPKNFDSSGAEVPPDNQRIGSGYGTASPPFTTSSNNDMEYQPFFIMKMVDNPGDQYCDYSDFLGANSRDFVISEAQYMSGNTSLTSGGATSGYTIANYGHDCDTLSLAGGPTDNPCYGKQTLYVQLTTALDDHGTYGCVANDVEFKKLLALYYKPNNNLYGGATYVARASNEYIPAGEYIATTRDNIDVNTTLTFQSFGGDTYTGIYDMMKTVKPDGDGAEYHIYEYNSSGVFQSISSQTAKFSTSFFFPCTSVRNPELRLGNHPNRSLSSTGGYGEDDYSMNSYPNAENDIKIYYPKPLNYQVSDEWRARVYFSEIKFDNETTDSWSQYLTNSYHDCEGTYGGINALITLNNQMYYLQDRAVGMLLINPVATVDGGIGSPVTLGTGETIQKHNNISIDIGTFHQWSVYRSQSAITFVDARHKKIYIFNGSSVSPVSDLKGQRNFVIKRLHNELLKNDNPVIDKGILTTYDYYNNEFLYTFNNVKKLTLDPVTYDTVNNENLTLAYSEIADNFTGMYTFAPNLYINSNKYLISTNRDNKLWFHNYGDYGSFYGTVFPALLKLIINDNPLFTKVFDNCVWNSESIEDNVEWNDDFNLYPGSPTDPLYPDDVNNQADTFTRIRCYNDWQNTDWVDLSTTPPNNNLTRKERNFNLQVPRNKFNYDSVQPSVSSLFNPANLTKTSFGERIRDKYVIIDLYYPNTANNRFIIHNLKSAYRISDR